MKKLKLLVFVLLLAAAFSACGNKFVFPKDSDFSLNATPSKTNLSIGEELSVKAIFQNLTDNKFTTNSKSGFIFINVVELNTPENVIEGSDCVVEIQPKQSITEEASAFKLDKAGNYKVYAISNFNITDPETGKQKAYSIRAGETLIEVR